MKRISVIATALLIVCVAAGAGAEIENCRVFFTRPGRGLNRHNPQNELVIAISRASRSILGAFYDISSKEIVDALTAAHARGIDVRLVTDDDNFDRSQVSRLIRSGIPVVCDSRGGLMHNKFAVIDGSVIWTGSYNTTGNGARRNNNNAVIVESPRLARIYRDEFDEMFYFHVFGNRHDTRPFMPLRNRLFRQKPGAGKIVALFAPENDIEGEIVRSIDMARKSICFMAFSFTSDVIGEAVIRAHKRGVLVRGIFEKRGSGSRYSEFIKMKIEGIPVRTDVNPYNMHHKVFIFDSSTVITGSYNFSAGAGARNDENVLIIRNPDIAGRYLGEFRRLYRER